MPLKKIFARIAYRIAPDELAALMPVSALAEPESLVTTRLLDTHEAHEDFIVRAIQQAERNVLIISPTVSSNRLRAKLRTDQFDGSLADLFALHSAGKNIRVICSDDMNLVKEDGSFKECYKKGLALLREVGCKINRKQRIHHKTLAVDRLFITEGSYNWLGVSAGHRREKTIICMGPEAGQRIADEWNWQKRNRFGVTYLS